jgi:Na+/H+ antiporter NhaC
LPIIALIIVTCGIIAWPAVTSIMDRQSVEFTTLLKDADPYASILYGSVASLTTAIILTLATGTGTLRSCFEWMTEGMSRLIGAVMILVLAWALSAASQELMVGEVVQQWLVKKNFSLEWLPVAVFASAAIVSFATGTSWGTMGILCPMVIIVASGLAAELPTDRAMHLFYGSVGSVLAGAIFGDHCSPISDTTVLSSVASGCSLEEHVWTQLPYALIAAVVGMFAGDMLCARLNWSPAAGIAVGIAVLILVVRIFGRRPIQRTD